MVEVLALVPARGGSKSLPRKNVRLLAGHPLIAYSIAAGQTARTVCRVIVSTDDEEIANVARLYGAEVPFARPSELAQDETPDLPVFQHALQWLDDNEGYRPEVVVQLRPTSPLRRSEHVDQAVELLLQNPACDAVRSVCPPLQNPFKMWKMGQEGFLEPLLKTEFVEPYNMPRQKLPPVLWHTGYVDATRWRTIMEKGSMTGRNILPLVTPDTDWIDIDSEISLRFAEFLISTGQVAPCMPKRVATASSPMAAQKRPRRFPQEPRLLVLDFDGVLTDNRVWVLEDGSEAVACSRADGLGLEMLRRSGLEVSVLSSEVNPVVGKRSRKLGLGFCQGVQDKGEALRRMMSERGLDPSQVIYVGNDVNDLQCIQEVGFGVAVADAHPAVRAVADWVLDARGGHGAVRELCDLIVRRLVERRNRDGSAD